MSINRVNYPGVAEDFPITPAVSALASAQPKLNLVQEGGQFYAPGTSLFEVLAAFDVCADLVTQMLLSAQACRVRRRIRRSPKKAVFQGLLNKRWCTAEQSQWIRRKTVQQLGWVVLENGLAL